MRDLYPTNYWIVMRDLYPTRFVRDLYPTNYWIQYSRFDMDRFYFTKFLFNMLNGAIHFRGEEETRANRSFKIRTLLIVSIFLCL